MAKAYELMTADPRGLSLEEIQYSVPAVFAGAAHESRSQKYGYISTANILESLRQETGLVPTLAMQARPRDNDRRGYAKHLLRLRHLDDLGYSKPDVHELVLVNSSDGSSSYSLYSGIFRVVCSNGMIDGDFDGTLRVRHSGDIAAQVVESTLEIIEEAPAIMEKVAEMKSIIIPAQEQLLLAESVFDLRFNLDSQPDEMRDLLRDQQLFQPADFLHRRRGADMGNDLHTVANVVQEHAIRGGDSRYDTTQHQRRRTRAINGIGDNVRLNQAVSRFAEELRKLHSQG